MNKKVEAWLEDSSPDSEVYQCALEYKKLESFVKSLSCCSTHDHIVWEIDKFFGYDCCPKCNSEICICGLGSEPA